MCITIFQSASIVNKIQAANNPLVQGWPSQPQRLRRRRCRRRRRGGSIVFIVGIVRPVRRIKLIKAVPNRGFPVGRPGGEGVDELERVAKESTRKTSEREEHMEQLWFIISEENQPN